MNATNANKLQEARVFGCFSMQMNELRGDINRNKPTTLVLAGGGARNAYLVDRIRHRCGESASVSLSDNFGIPCSAREAMGFAVLGALAQDKVPITLPQVTGATDPGTAGVWARP